MSELWKRISEKASKCIYYGMSLKYGDYRVCSECGKEIEASADICPYCGCPAEPKRKRRGLKYAIIALVVLAVGGVGFKIANEKILKPMKKYNVAAQILKNGKYEKAQKAFEELDGFGDSEKKWKGVIT
jgi:TolA-binding protein